MSGYFEIVPARPIEPAPPSPDEVARGDYWALLKREEEYVLEYISGEMYGRLKQLVVTEEEARQLMRGEVQTEREYKRATGHAWRPPSGGTRTQPSRNSRSGASGKAVSGSTRFRPDMAARRRLVATWTIKTRAASPKLPLT